MLQTTFWTVTAAMVALTALTVAIPLLKSEPNNDARTVKHARRRWYAAAAIAVGAPVLALALYNWFGSPAHLQSAAAPSGNPAPHPMRSADGEGAASDMNAAIARLEARLAANPNDPEGWKLLAQSYDFVGRSAEASTARIRASGEPAPPTQQSFGDLAAAQQARRARNFDLAVTLFARAAAQGDLSADDWADYADAVGAQQRGLRSSEPMIREALRRDAKHLKALWLLGSLQTERGESSAALATWRKLATLIPPDSPDARIIAANIAEASDPRAAPPAPAGSRTAGLHGQIALDRKLRDLVKPGMTLFVFAKAVDSPGPPLAVLRTTATSWPVSFALDDSMAMMPDRKLSKFRRVTVEARLSRSGSADPAAGDLRGSSSAIDLQSGSGPLTVTIGNEVR